MQRIALVLISSIVSTACALALFWGEAALFDHLKDDVTVFSDVWLLVFYFILMAVIIYPVMAAVFRNGSYLKVGVLASLTFSALVGALFYSEEVDSLPLVSMVSIGMFGVPLLFGWVAGNLFVKKCHRLHA